jgi:hypothetical protein
MRNSLRLFLVILVLFMGTVRSSAQTPDVFITIDRYTVINPKSTHLLGITFDARSSMRGNNGPVGYHDTNGVLLPEMQSIFGDMSFSTVRYPANAISFGFDWKGSIGPSVKRSPQNIIGIGPAQPMKFGFDEFMAMANAHGTSSADVQIMVSIYSKSDTGLTSLQMVAAMDDAAGSAADWVEYANGPNNGTNWGGGRDWAALRDSNGHPTPYGINIWNLGNEPWADGEFGNDSIGAKRYLQTIRPIIDSILARDPGIRITVPSTGPATSEWNKVLLNDPFLRSKIYGISPHFFPDETMMNGTIALGISKVETGLKAIADSAKKKGLKVIVGDYAHGIPMINHVPSGDPDLAMQWQGANLSADFLMVMSQIPNVERVNFWAYGLPAATWHPIRYNAPGSYTLMPTAVMYKRFYPLFLDLSIGTTTISPKGSDGNLYSVRAGGFQSADSSKMTVIAVNRDKVLQTHVQVNGMTGYSVNKIMRWRASALTSDTVIEEVIAADSNGTIPLPPMGIIAIQYSKGPLLVFDRTGSPAQFRLEQNHPNPFNPTTNIQYALGHSGMVQLEVYNVVGQRMRLLRNEQHSAGTHRVEWDAKDDAGEAVSSGVYFYKVTATSNNEKLFSETKKMVLMK